MMRKTGWIAGCWLALAVAVMAGQDGLFEWGGCYTADRDRNLRVEVGSVLEIEGMVQETTRRLYDVTGSTWKQNDAERYDESDFNMDGPYGAIGIGYDRAWHFITFQLDSLFFQPSIDTVARRNYYIGVGDSIEFQGQSYDRMKIPQGTPFTAKIVGNMTEMVWLLTPVGINIDDYARINPSIGAGLLFFVGDYSIDAGDPTGTVLYQNPPVPFVVGGRSGGLVGLVVPEIGFGGEVRLGDLDTINLILQAHYMFLQYDGSTKFFTTSDHREKNADIDHNSFRLRGYVEFPFRNGNCFTTGLQVHVVKSDGAITSTATDPAEILANQERFDKEFAFRISTVLLTAGITF